MAETPNQRVTRLENLMGVLAEKQASLDGVLVVLSEAQIKLTEAQIKTEKRFRETDARFRDTAERFRDTDARIEKLVIAIGEFLRGRTQ
ncbi:MAG TPA: hypothetical protein VMR62_04435 [Bryobacteraceae bacterium]|jgi:hypothetical protein|nr:hypothetical protein [Bryobacteraceae bacterium]